MIVARAPLRISFAGGQSDLPVFYKANNGAVVSAAIDKYIYVCVGRHFDPQSIRISYSRTENVSLVSDLQHDLVRTALESFGLQSGVEVVSIADIPSEGTGLGSSASYLVALLAALGRYTGSVLSPMELAERAFDIEANILGRSCGKQDQYASAFGGLNYLRFLRGSGMVNVEPVDMRFETKCKLESRLRLYYTGVTRKSEYILQGVGERLESQASALASQQSMVGLVSQMREALVDGRLDEFGFLMHEAWDLKKRVSRKVTRPEIDRAYNAATTAGALGGKICGAGAGGFLMLYVPDEYSQDVDRAMRTKGYRGMDFRFSDEGCKTWEI